MKNERLLRRAFQAAFEVGERVRYENNHPEWTDEEVDAAAMELRRRIIGEQPTLAGGKNGYINKCDCRTIHAGGSATEGEKLR